MEVYADVLVAMNILFTYLFIVATRVACKTPTNKWGIAVASVVGGFSSLIIFVGEIHILISVLYRIVVALVITTLAFLPRTVKKTLKIFFCFLGISFLFGGVMFGIEILFNPENIFFINGTVYFNMSITYLVISVMVVYGVFLGCSYLFDRKIVSTEVFDVKIYFRNTYVILRGVIDTGNNLKDGVFSRPVIVAELESLKGLFTDEEIKYFKKGDLVKIPLSLETKMHLVPCKTVAGKNMLPAIIPQKVELFNRGKGASTDYVTVAIASETLSSGEYNALLYKEITELNWSDSKGEKIIY